MESKNNGEMVSTPNKVLPSLIDYEDMIKDKNCSYCNGHLGGIEYYPHDGGWLVDGFSERQWLYKTCMKCGYQWALRKIGVDRF